MPSTATIHDARDCDLSPQKPIVYRHSSTEAHQTHTLREGPLLTQSADDAGCHLSIKKSFPPTLPFPGTGVLCTSVVRRAFFGRRATFVPVLLINLLRLLQQIWFPSAHGIGSRLRRMTLCVVGKGPNVSLSHRWYPRTTSSTPLRAVLAPFTSRC